MNNYIITYEGTDSRYAGERCEVAANTAREAIIAFYKKNLAPLCVSASNGCIYNIYGEVVQSGDDWIQYGKGRFTAKLADEKSKENSSEENQIKELQLEVERLQADKEAFERLSEKAKQAYSDLQGKCLDESIAYNKEYQRLQDEIDRLKAENDRLKAHIEIQQERATEAAFRSLEVIQDLHNKLTQSVPK